jgi:hypothetical protein
VFVSGSEGPRFAQFFQQAYAKLPGGVREQIEEHWKSMPSSPELILEDKPYLVADDHQSIGVAMTDEEGHRLRFAGVALGWLVAKYGGAVAVSMIVHELAHVHSWAERKVEVLTPREADAYRRAVQGDRTAIDLLERLADERMVSWGSIRNLSVRRPPTLFG